MEMGSEVAVIGHLVAALETATLMAKQLPNTTEPSHIRHIYSTLHSTHLNLTTFLANHPIPTPTPTPFPQPPPPPAENSVSSAVAGGGGDDYDTDEPMQVVDDENETEQNSKISIDGQNSKISIDGVEERMRECFIQNKRPKRPLSPSTVAEQRRSYDNEAVRGGYVPEFDPQGTRLRALDLIYQFHS